MKILSICCDKFNREQAKGIVYWLKGNENSFILEIPNIRNIFISYFILIIYFLFLQWFTFISFKENFTEVIVVGRSVVAQAIIIGHQLKIPVSTVQKPFGYPYFFFKKQYIPYHDIKDKNQINKNTVITYLAPNTMVLSNIKRQNNKISFLIGGSLHNKKYNFEKLLVDIENIISDKKNNNKYSVEFIVSRRTPLLLIDKLAEKKFKINSKYGSTKDAYYHSKVLYITDDSFSMISEAIQSGAKPNILRTNNTSEKLKKGIEKLNSLKLLNYLK